MKNSFQPSAELIKLASSYFARHGIDPRVEPAPGSFPLAVPPVPAFSSHTAAAITTNPCVIHVLSALFYTYCGVFVPAIGKRFEGHSGGLGIGDLTAFGVIYYDNLSVLLSTGDFGVFYGAEAGGVIHVTWGASGNATAAGVGEGAGAFGGRGAWE